MLIYFCNIKKSVAEAHRMLSLAHGDLAINERTCRVWYQCFQNGEFHMEGRYSRGRQLLERQKRNGFLHRTVIGVEK